MNKRSSMFLSLVGFIGFTNLTFCMNNNYSSLSPLEKEIFVQGVKRVGMTSILNTLAQVGELKDIDTGGNEETLRWYFCSYLTLKLRLYASDVDTDDLTKRIFDYVTAKE